jgi:capsular polysaccharide transport system permease protein
MNDSTEPTALSGPSTALERAQAVSRALAEAARRARFSVRARRAYHGGSSRTRRGSKFIRIAAITLLIVVVAIPNLIALVYFGLLASDQYIAEAKFTVSSGIIPKMDTVGAVTGVPPALIVQNTQVVTNYIASRPMVEQLEQSVGLRQIYTSSKIDWWARFRKRPIEKFVDYWENMCTASITLPSGIVTVRVRAFSPEDAKRIADAVVAGSEKLINDMNERVRNDTVQASERDMQAAADELGRARMKMQYGRNAEGLIDVGQTSRALSGLLTEAQGQLLTAQQEYQTQLLRSVSEDAPQMRVLQSRISAMRLQVDDLKSQLTTQKEQSASADADKALSGKMTKFAEYDLDERLAEKRYATSVAAVEAARILSERKMLYLHELVSPALPQDPRYPRRLLSIGLTFVGSILCWVTSMTAISFVRNHMA